MVSTAYLNSALVLFQEKSSHAIIKIYQRDAKISSSVYGGGNNNKQNKATPDFYAISLMRGLGGGSRGNSNCSTKLRITIQTFSTYLINKPSRAAALMCLPLRSCLLQGEGKDRQITEACSPPA